MSTENNGLSFLLAASNSLFDLYSLSVYRLGLCYLLYTLRDSVFENKL